MTPALNQAPPPPGPQSPGLFGGGTEPQPAQDPVALFGDTLKRLVTDDIRTDLDPEKVYQLSDLRRLEYYWRGLQFLRRVNKNGMVDWAPLTPYNTSPNDGRAEDLYSYYSNDVRGYGRKFIGVIAQEPPAVKFKPNKATSQDHVRRAQKAQAVGDILRGLWNVKDLGRQAAFGFWKSGTQFIYTPFVADADKYGTSSEPVMEDQQIPLEPPSMKCQMCGQTTPIPEGDIPPRACPGPMCGQEFGPEDFVEPETIAFPMPTGESTSYPNGCAEAHLYNGMYVSTPFWIRSLADTPWLLLEYEEYKGKLLAAYKGKPEIYARLTKMRDQSDSEGGLGGYAESMANTTRALSQSPSGTVILPHRNRWLYTRVWMRPSEYEMVKEADKREGLAAQFPNGLKLVIVQDKVLEIEPAILDYEWVMGQPETAENAYPDPIAKDFLSSQDLTNTCLNINAETLERQIPQTLIDTDQLDIRARKKHQLPGGFIPMRRKGGQRMEDAIARVTVAKAEPEMTSFPVLIREHAAENAGITREIFGGTNGKEQTAYEASLKKNQALIALSPQLDALKKLIAGAEQNGVMQMALHSGGKIPSPHAPRTETEDIEGIEELAEGGWHAEADDALPQTSGERRASLLELMKNSPQALGALGFGEIDNIPIVQSTIVGLPDWKVPNSDALEKVNRSIRQLLQGSPVTQPSQQFPGQEIKIPSIPVDEWDDHEFFAAATMAWLETSDASQDRQNNPNGFENVVAFWKSHKGLAVGAAMAAQGMGGPGGPPPPPSPSSAAPSAGFPKGSSGAGPSAQTKAPDGTPQRLSAPPLQAGSGSPGPAGGGSPASGPA